ncbi:MAG: hypothetical protein M9894_16480 [Planctomycetes bacterium]|nr:hypothetical protein [Planctomycetota bacterium]
MRRSPRAGRAALALALALLAPACAPEERPDAPARGGQVPSLVPLLDEDGRAVGVGAIVRTTDRAAVLVASPCPAGPLPERLVVALGLDRLPVVRDDGRPVRCEGRDLLLVEVPRGERDLRPVGPAGPPHPGDAVRVVTPGLGALVVQATTVAEVVGAEVRLTALARAGAGDVRSFEARAQEAAGAAVLTADGALLGFVTGAHGPRPVVTPLASVAGLLPAVLASPGPDVLAPDHEAVTLRVRVAEVQGLPTLHDDWGDPDFFLTITLGDAPLPPLPLFEPAPPLLVRARAAGPAVLRLVERDVTLGAGETALELSAPVTLPALEPGTTTITFPLARAVLAQRPESRAGSRRTRVSLKVERVDPEARSGADRTPLGAVVHDLGRVVSGRLDLADGDGTDLHAIDARAGQPIVAVLLRREPRARAIARAYPPDFSAPLFTLEPPPHRWLSVARAEVAAGRTFVRVATLDGRPTTYHLLLAPAGQPEALVRALFRLVARAAEDRLPYLGSREFARELAVGLTFGAGLDPPAVARAVLAELGHRRAEARHLALHLLEAHFPPAPDALEETYRQAADGPRGLDAGLLLAAQRPNELRTDDVVARAQRDPDPSIKLRALDLALRVDDPDRRERLGRALAESDATGLVRKALARADLGP